MSMADDERRQRALARSTWVGRVVRLDELPEVELVGGTPSERIGLVRELTLAAWAMRGATIPTYTRAEMPGRVIRAEDKA